MRGRVALAASALLVAACSPPSTWGRPEVDLCTLAPQQQVAEALGVAVDSARKAARGSRPSCVWQGAPADDARRSLTAVLWREDDLKRAAPPLTVTALFDSELRALELEYPRTRVLGLGDAAVMGFGALDENGFSGALLVRKGQNVLTMRIVGADPAAFEDVARGLVAKI